MNISCGVQVTDVDITVIELRLPKLVQALALLCEAKSSSSVSALLLLLNEARKLSASIEVWSSLKASVADRGLVKSM